jgi:Acyl-CoA carboxylase epsilon subunit
MIQITKGDPTPSEIAALVAVLALACATTHRGSGSTGSAAAGWRGSAPAAEFDSDALSRVDRCCRHWRAGWSRVAPAHAPEPHRTHWAGTRDVS